MGVNLIIMVTFFIWTGSQVESGPTTPLPDKKLLVFILDRLQKCVFIYYLFIYFSFYVFWALNFFGLSF